MEERSHYTIRTSDRRVFRRCLRKWAFQSSMRGNWKYKGTEQNINFWFGSAIHFAMEDFHGENRFGDPRLAFWAYYQAFSEDELPPGAEAHYPLGISMLSYYLTWYKRHNEASGFETALLDPETGELVDPHICTARSGLIPAVEQSFMIPLKAWVAVDHEDNIVQAYWAEEDIPVLDRDEFGNLVGGFDGDRNEMPAIGIADYVRVKGRLCTIVPINYHGTIDRIVFDKLGRLWILDYKTAKGADTNKLDTDDQISAYMWAFKQLFGVAPYGFIYLQLTKDAVQMPKRLKNKELSVDKRQKTTYSLVKQEIIDEYGKVQNAPDKIIQFLNYMAEQESPEGDRFIRWDFVKRSDAEIAAHERHIYGELKMMLDPTLYCFPSPTRDCIWDCPVRDWCLALDRGDDELVNEFMLNFEKRPHNEDGNVDEWRENIPYPTTITPEGRFYEKEENGMFKLYPLPDLEEIIEYDLNMTIELDSDRYANESSSFNFEYEEK